MVLHQQLAQGGWQKLTFNRQLGNIGAEITRARVWQEKGNLTNCQKSLERAWELINLTLSQNLSSSRFKEISRFKEVVAGLILQKENYQVSFKDLENFCLSFAFLV